MRNIVAHSYGTVDPETTWEIIHDDIPDLKEYCQKIIIDSKLLQSEADITNSRLLTEEELDYRMEERFVRGTDAAEIS